MVKKNRTKRSTTRNKTELDELEIIKKLLVIQLLKSDVPADYLSELLDMDRGDFSRIFPIRKLQK